MPDYLSYLEQMARRYGVPVEEARAIYALETASGRNVRTSSAGAQGHMQLMPATARELGVDPNDPYQNIRGGVKYYSQQRKRFGDPALAAAAYNAGPGRVQRAGNKVPQIDETQRYVTNFLNNIGRVRPSQPAPYSATTAVGGAPQGQMSMDDTEGNDVEMGALGAFGMPGGLTAPTAAEWQTLQEEARKVRQDDAALRKSQFEEGQKLIQQNYGGPSSADRLWAISRALLAPRPYRGFAGTMHNLTNALGGISQERTEAERKRAEALLALQQSYQRGEMQGRGDDLSTALEMLKARQTGANAASGRGMTYDAQRGIWVNRNNPRPTENTYDIGGGRTLVQWQDGFWREAMPNGAYRVFERAGDRFKEVPSGGAR